MLRTIIVALLLLIFVRPATAHDGEFAEGWIAGLDELDDKVILDDGRSYVVSPDISFDSLSPGSRVKLTIASTPWGKVVIQIAPAPASSPLGQGASGV